MAKTAVVYDENRNEKAVHTDDRIWKNGYERGDTTYCASVEDEMTDAEEPGAGIPHAGIRAGAAGQPAVLPRLPLCQFPTESLTDPGSAIFVCPPCFFYHHAYTKREKAKERIG